MRLRRVIGVQLGIVLIGALFASHAVGAPAPAWEIQSIPSPTNFKPGEESGLDRYLVFIANSGGDTTDSSPITITDTLPAGLTVKSVFLRSPRNMIGKPDNLASACQTNTIGDVSTVLCEVTESLPETAEPAKLHPGNQLVLEIQTIVPATAAGSLTNSVKVEGGGAPTVEAEFENEATIEEADSGFAEFSAGLVGSNGEPATGSGSHPYQYVTTFAVNTRLSPPGSFTPIVPAKGDLKDVEVGLPPGLVGNPTATERCTVQDFNTIHSMVDPGGGNVYPNECPPGSAVGIAAIRQLEGGPRYPLVPIYNLVPPKGMPAQLALQPVLGLPVYINTRLRSDGDFGITAFVSNITQAQRVMAARITIWGNPADPSHDPLRAQCAELGGSCPFELPARPFLRLPTSCEASLGTTMIFKTWPLPGLLQATSQATSEEPAPTACEVPDFSPSISAQPTTNVADSPSGLDFNLHLPQLENNDPEGVAEADLRVAKVKLPEGFLVNPASADGLDGCSTAEINLTSAAGETPARFSSSSPECPDASKIGSVQVDTPLLDQPLPGAVYLADPYANPFDSLLAIYITVDDPESGVVVKLAGKVEADPVTGQLTTTVEDSPQVPFEDFRLSFFGGDRAPLRTPATCGTHTVTSALRPWTAPASGPDATPAASFQINQTPAGGDCPTTAAARPNSPEFEAGTATPLAGAYSPFILKLSRKDGSQELKGLNVELPPGLTGRLVGLSYCPEGALAAAAAQTGRAEQASASCPASSELGTVTVAAGAGPAPYHVQGRAYLAGPYKGAPISMAFVTPAVAGPFDLGTVVVRAALQVDPETARIRAVSDPIPTILQGIPLDVRSIVLRADRDGFTLNPTSCDPSAVSGEAISLLGQPAALTSRFQVGGCSTLAFKPQLSLQLKGGTRRTKHPQLRATLKMPAGGANIAMAQVALPRALFLDQSNIRTICTRVQFAADDCPARAIYGYAKAWTPLLEKPLEGPVYLRSSNHELPDLVADLNGQIPVVLHGRTDSFRGGLRNTFEGVPDAPASKFVLTLQGGKRGLLVNSRNICGAKMEAKVRFVAQSGKESSYGKRIATSCGGGAKKRNKRPSGKR